MKKMIYLAGSVLELVRITFITYFLFMLAATVFGLFVGFFLPKLSLIIVSAIFIIVIAVCFAAIVYCVLVGFGAPIPFFIFALFFCKFFLLIVWIVHFAKPAFIG